MESYTKEQVDKKVAELMDAINTLKKEHAEYIYSLRQDIIKLQNQINSIRHSTGDRRGS